MADNSGINSLDPVLFTVFRANTDDDPYIQKHEHSQVINGMVRLSEIPQQEYGVDVTPANNSLMYEVDDEGDLASNQFHVDYNTGIVHFSKDHEGQTLTFDYLGIGQILVNAERVYVAINTQHDGIIETLQELIDNNRAFGNIIHRCSPISTYSKMASTYPVPVKGDMVQTLDDSKMYIWTGSKWLWFYTFPTAQVYKNKEDIATLFQKLADLTKSLNDFKTETAQNFSNVNKRIDTEDKKIDDTKSDLTNTINNTKNDLQNDIDHNSDEISDLQHIETDFDIRNLEPQFVMNLGGVRDAVNQSFNIDPNTDQVYQTQSASDTTGAEGFFITRLCPNGRFRSGMWIQEGGHGTTIAIENKTDGKLKIWVYHNTLKKLIQFDYTSNKILSKEEAQNYTDYTPSSIKGQYFTPVYDPYYDRFCFRFGDGRIQIRNRSDVVNHVDKVIHEFRIDPNKNNDNMPMQGCTLYGDTVYWLSGWANTWPPTKSTPMLISKYNAATGKEEFSLDVKNLLITDAGRGMFQDDYIEPEGITYYINPKNGKHSLLFAITVGALMKRHHIVYAFNQRNASDHWDSVTRAGSQKYAFTRGDGRCFNIPNGVTSLKQLVFPGYYHIWSEEAKTLKDFPYKPGDAAWYLFVSPYNQNMGGFQTLSRFSAGRKIVKFTRSFSYDWKHLEWSFGIWTTIGTSAPHQEYLDPDEWGYYISNVIYPGEYYITSAQIVRFKDIGSSLRDGISRDAGYRLYVTSADQSGACKQVLSRNSNNNVEIYMRQVNVNTKKTTHWLNLFSRFNAGAGIGAATYARNINPGDFDNRLDNIRRAGTYYITDADAHNLEDHPTGSGGWMMHVDFAASTSEYLIQTLTNMDHTKFEIWKRTIATNGNVIQDSLPSPNSHGWVRYRFNPS